MEHKHLDAAALEHLLATDRTAEQNEQLFHLLAVCPPCREVGGWLLDLHRSQALPPVFGSIDAALARSRAEAPRLLDEIKRLDPPDRLTLLHADRRFRNATLSATRPSSSTSRLRSGWRSAASPKRSSSSTRPSTSSSTVQPSTAIPTSPAGA